MFEPIAPPAPTKGTVQLRPDGTIAGASLGLARLLDRQPGELIGRQLLDFIATADCPTEGQDSGAWSLLLGAGEEARRCFGLLRPDGTTVRVDCAASVIRDQHGAVIQAVAVFDEVNPRRRQETEARHSHLNSLGHLAAGIAHEINTPLQYMGDNLDFVATGVRDLLALYELRRELCGAPDDGALSASDRARLAEAEDAADLDYLREQLSRSISSTREGVRRVAATVQAIKSFSASHQGPKTTANLNSTLIDTLTVAADQIRPVARIETALGELPLVPCYPGDLHQVFLQLLTNAAQAIRDAAPKPGNRGRILVSSRLEGDEVVVAVADNGVGIPDVIRDRVFEPFFTTRSAGQGMGYGLAVAHAVVVDKHGGSLTFTSDVGKGTTFQVRLPVQPIPEAVVPGRS